MSGSLPMVAFPDGGRAVALGLGTWRMGERARLHAQELRTLVHGLDAGMTLVDTAEMYGEGAAETLVGEALAGRRRDEVFVVTKVYPHNAGGRALREACARSLKRLRIERIDLYLLHWRGAIPLAQTVAGFEALVREGRIARWGVSNFDVADMDELSSVPEGARCACNQVLYNLGERGIEWALLERCRARGVPVMAYSPVGQGDLARDRRLRAIASRIGATPAQVALAWLVHRPGVIAIPKASSVAHVDENRAAGDVRLDAATLAELDSAFPPPKRATPLAML